jgi:hypothetical protein
MNKVKKHGRQLNDPAIRLELFPSESRGICNFVNIETLEEYFSNKNKPMKATIYHTLKNTFTERQPANILGQQHCIARTWMV